MKLTKLLALFLVSATVNLGACSDDGGDVGSPEALLNELGDTFCEAQVACDDFPDLTTCREAEGIESDSELQNMLAAIEAGTLVYNEDAGADCLAAYEAINFCALAFDRGEFEAADEACQRTFTGQVAVGGDCFDDVECVGGGDCLIPECPDECCVGACQAVEPPPQLAPIGAACEGFDECVYDGYCKIDFATGDGTCEALLNEGDECEDLFACAGDLGCDLDFVTLMGVCRRLPGNGEACNPDSLIGCSQTNLYCDEVDSTCKRYPDVGDSCDPAAEQACVYYAECVDGACVQRPGLGDSCVELPDCLGGLSCDSGVCVTPEPGPVCR